MILPRFGEYNNYNEAGSKPGLILFWVRDIVAVYKVKSQMSIDYGDIDIYEINRIGIVVRGNHGQEVFQFPIKILLFRYVIRERISISSLMY